MKENDAYTAIMYAKAESRSRWVYIGLFFPLIGIIIGMACMHALEMLEKKGVDDLNDIRSRASRGIALSWIILLLNTWLLINFFNTFLS